jgi:hypothetical protein
MSERYHAPIEAKRAIIIGFSSAEISSYELSWSHDFDALEAGRSEKRAIPGHDDMCMAGDGACNEHDVVGVVARRCPH